MTTQVEDLTEDKSQLEADLTSQEKSFSEERETMAKSHEQQ